MNAGITFCSCPILSIEQNLRPDRIINRLVSLHLSSFNWTRKGAGRVTELDKSYLLDQPSQRYPFPIVRDFIKL